MPMYDYQCDACSLVFESYNRMSACRSAECPKCGKPASQVFITPPQAFREILPYYDNGLGEQVQDRADRKRIMDKKGLVEADESLTRMAKEIREEDADCNRNKRR